MPVPYDEIIREGMIGSKLLSLLFCRFSISSSFFLSEFTVMANAIKDLAKSTGKPPMLFSLCQWGRVSSCAFNKVGFIQY